MTTMLLTKKGHVVARAVNGAEAVIMIKSAADDREKEGSTAVPLYDVVLMDLQMPVMDGIEAIRRVRNDERGLVDLECGGKHRQLIIALSANSDSETMQEALDAGADHFISKPFAYETFYDFMSKQLKVVE
jgi:CheY-like chemotaxis protein